MAKVSFGRFKASLEFVGKWEGIYSDDKDDPGGATKYGITQKTLSEYCGRKVSKQEVQDLTYDRAKTIYHTLYWQKAYCTALPAGLDTIMFDCAVNQGVPTAKKILQQTLKLKPDGIFGIKTMAAISMLDQVSTKDLSRDFLARRAVRYANLLTFWKYGFGWFRRLFDLHAFAIEQMR